MSKVKMIKRKLKKLIKTILKIAGIAKDELYKAGRIKEVTGNK